MKNRPLAKVEAIKKRIGHPIVDADAHQLETVPVRARLSARGRRQRHAAALPRLPEAPAPDLRHEARGAARHADLDAGLVADPDREHPRPRDDAAAAADVRAARRVRTRLQHRLPGDRPAGHHASRHGRRRAAARECAGVQSLQRGPLRGVQRSADAGGRHPDAHAGRGDRGARVRSPRVEAQGRGRGGGRVAAGAELRAASIPSSRRRCSTRTASGSTRPTTTIRSGRNASSSGLLRRHTRARSVSGRAAASRATSTTSSAASPRAARRC